MLTQLQNIAVRRLRLIPIQRGAGITAPQRASALAELARLGVRVHNRERLAHAAASFFDGYGELIRTLTALRGGDVAYVPLFSKFPDDVPDDGAYLARRLIGYLGNLVEAFDDSDGQRLENGLVVPDWLFDLEDFGADPITQFQSTGLWDRAKRAMARRLSDSRVEWTDVALEWEDAVEDKLRGWLQDCLYAKSSIKEALHEDLRALLQLFGVDAIDFDRIALKENRALVLALLWSCGQESSIPRLVSSPTDVLRLFAAVTNTDVSLATKIRFPKLSRRQRRIVLSALEQSSSLAEDLQRYRGLWLELGRYIHPSEYRKTYPNTARAFDALRNGSIETFESRTEELMRRGRLGATLGHLARRPGLLARKLHELLRRFPGGTGSIIDAFSTMAPTMTVKNLLVLRSYFDSINELEHRTVINKRGKIKVLPNNARYALADDSLGAVTVAIDRALRDSVAAREAWTDKSVWIDPALARYTVPLAQRAASDGLVSFGRGSRVPIDLSAVLRLFVYWKEATRRTDLDLSVIQFDKDFGYAGHVSYTNLSSSGIVHSGDLQSAPHGAAEFIDITLSALPRKVRFLAPQVYRYAGDAFADMTCHAGWMLRDRVDANYKTFDIQTVANKFDLSGTGGYCVPMYVDLERSEVVFTDLYMGARAFYNNVEGAHGNVALACREIGRFTHTRPTLSQLAELHAVARGARAASARDAADITFGVSDCTYNAGDTERILAELM